MRIIAAITTLVALSLAGCSTSSESSGTVTLVTHDSFAVSKPVLRAFEHRTGLKVRVLKAGDAGAALNQVILTKGAPFGDAFFGVDNTFLSRATAANVFSSYRSPELTRVPHEFQLDPSHQLTPVDYGDVCVNYDRAALAARGVEPPESLDDLVAPRYRGLLVTENPATSSPGLAFLLGTVARYGDGWRGYWSRLRANDVKVVDGWEQAYSSEFSGSAGKGSYPLVVSYASSPPAEISTAGAPPATAPTAAALGTCFRQVELAGVIRGAKHPAAARQLVDFMLSARFQGDVPDQMYVYPVRAGVPVPDAWARYAPVPAQPFQLAPAEIGRHRDEWIDQWTATTLR